MTTGTALAFGRNDLIGVRRDPMFRFLLLAPLIYIALIRFALPAVTDMVTTRFSFDLVPYHPLVISLLLVLGTTMILSALAGLLMIEERDARTLAAIRVTPASLSGFAAYRSGAVAALVLAYVVITILLSGYFESRMLPTIVAAGLCAGLLGAVIMVLMALISNNKLEGLAILRAIGLLVTGLPILPWFVPTPWEYLFAALPAYWPVKIYWVGAEGGAVWIFALIGMAYNGLLLVLLIRAFSHRQHG